MAIVMRSHDTMHEFVERCVNGTSEMSDGMRSSRTGDTSWVGDKGWKDTAKLAAYGWAEGREEVERLSAALLDKVATRMAKPEVRLVLDGGDSVDVGRLLMGDPECVQVLEDSEVLSAAKNGKVIKILYNCAASACIDQKTIRAKGAAVAALVDALEYAGRRCEVIVTQAINGWGGNGGESHYECSVMLKRANDPLQMDSLAFAIAHPGMLRRMMFSYEECEPASIRSEFGVPGGYGTPTNSKLEDADIRIERSYGTEPAWKNPESAAQWVLDTLKAQGIELVEA